MTELKNLRPLDPAAWDPSLAAIVRDMGGRPLNVHGLLANHPDLLRAWWDLRNHTVTGGELGARNAELAILRVACHAQSWYEWGSHVQRGLAAGLSLEEIERVPAGPADSAWQPAEASLLRAVDELFFERALSPARLDELGAHFTERQVLDLIALQGVYAILACLLNTWEVPLDAAVAAALPDGVTREGFEKGIPGADRKVPRQAPPDGATSA